MVKRAICIGLNYPESDMELQGCYNDAINWKNVLEEKFGFSQIDLMLDAEYDEEEEEYTPVPRSEPMCPTKRNILAAIDRHVRITQPGDHLVITYSGHGTQVPDATGDEEDGLDEALCPVDCDEFDGAITPYRLIIDDDLEAKLSKLPAGSCLTFICDACHSGTILDTLTSLDSTPLEERLNLKAKHDLEDERGLDEFEKEVNQRPWLDPLSRQRHALPRRFPLLPSAPMWRKIKNLKRLFMKRPQFKSGVVAYCISGCRDDQTSLDVHVGGERQGAMSYCLQKSLQSLKWSGSYGEFFNRTVKVGEHVRSEMIPAMDQFFQFSYSASAHPNTDPIFSSIGAYQDAGADEEEEVDEDEEAERVVSGPNIPMLQFRPNMPWQMPGGYPGYPSPYPSPGGPMQPGVFPSPHGMPPGFGGPQMPSPHQPHMHGAYMGVA